MKICLIGFTRSRSSIVVETISNFYKIPIIGTEFNETLPRELPNRDWMSDQTVPTVPENHWTKVRQSLNKINDQEIGVIRYHPEQLSFIPFNGELLDFNLFKFEHYDKILFTTRRDISAMIASRFIATKLNRWTYNFQKDVSTTIVPQTLNQLDYYHIKLTLYNNLIVERLQDYFLKNNIQYTQVEYDDVPSYLTNNYPLPNTYHCSMVETNYDYKSIITNFDEIIDLYEKFKSEVQTMFNRFNK